MGRGLFRRSCIVLAVLANLHFLIVILVLFKVNRNSIAMSIKWKGVNNLYATNDISLRVARFIYNEKFEV